MHPAHKFGVTDNSMADIALVRLRDEIKFVPGIIAPICLESFDLDLKDKPRFDKENFQAYVAGFGKTAQACGTNGIGPEKYQPCDFPFLFNGQFHKNCITGSSTPSKDNQICLKLKEYLGTQITEGIGILYTDEYGFDRKTTCYPLNPGQFGWCAACDSVGR